MSSRLPYFPFYADDFLVGTMAMDAEERGIYITLLCLQFANGNRIVLPLAKLSQLCDSSDGKVMAVLQMKFEKTPDGWINLRLKDEYEKASEKKEKRVNAGKKGADARWDHGKANAVANGKRTGKANGKRNAVANGNQNQNQNQVSISKDIDTKRGRHAARPSIEEVTEYCQERGGKVDPEQFLDHYTANGWRQANGNLIRDWKAAVRTWERRQGEFGNKGVQAAKRAPSKEEVGF